MAEIQRAVNRVKEELEQRGARAVSVQGNVQVGEYQQASDPLGVQPTATASVDYDGDPEWVRNAVRSLNQVEVQDVQDETYPGGDTHVSADIVLLGSRSGGSNPRGNVDTSPSSSTVPPPVENEATQDPHVAPGGTWVIQDENGIADEYEVEVWPVRVWEARPGVPAATVLRYIPHPAAEGMQWWSGYVRAAPEDGLGSVDWQSLRARIDAGSHSSDHPCISYYDGAGWVGWKHGEVRGEVDNQVAAEATKALAQAALEARREVVR